MNRRRPFIPQRIPVFVGCEGESERGYVGLLARLVDQQKLAIHLDPVLLQPGGGDPCSLIELASQKLDERTRRRGARYKAKFVLLDADRIGEAPARDIHCRNQANLNGLQLVWQTPCHEALLLHHLENCQSLKPSTTLLAIDQLKKRWPSYEKGMAAAQLARHLDLKAIHRAARVELDLAILLEAIGLL